jgi:tetratricopeptide (TPR) repeat protein
MSWLRRMVGGGGSGVAEAGLRSIRFDTAGWVQRRTSGDTAEWRDADGDALRAIFHDTPSPLFEAADPVSVREHFRREAAASSGGIVSVEPVIVRGTPCVRVIKKFERLPAYAFEGVLVLGFEASHCVLTIESIERGTTGVRDSVVTAHLWECGALELSETPGVVPGWFLDPYLEAFDGPVLHALSDDERLDPLFPKHPLSKVRRALAHIEKTLELDPGLRPGKPKWGRATLPAPDTPGGHVDRARRPMSTAAVAGLHAKVGRTAQAIAMLTQAIREAERAQAGDHELANLAMELGRVHFEAGDLASAEAPLRRAATLLEGSGRNRELAPTLLSLAFACEQRGNLDEAEAVLRKALTALEAGPPAEPLRLQIVVNLGRMCIGQHKADEAEPLFQEALRAFEKEDPSRGSNVAIALNGLGLICNERGHYAEAIPLFQRALRGFQEALGPDQPDVATVLTNMAYSWHKLGDQGKAEELLRRAARVGRG